MTESSPRLDVAVVGAGAAGLATAIFAARRSPGRAVAALDGARKPGAKILVSGGGRCNVTNSTVQAGDFRGGSSNVVRRILNAFPVERTVAFFREIGVSLHEEPDGKLFPDTNSSRTVLDALLRESDRSGARILPGHRVTSIERRDGGFELATSSGVIEARRVVLATGGMSLPKSGSDGTGYRLAERLGHSMVPPTPALVALLLDGDFHASLSGISHVVELTLRAEGRKPERLRGALLWTHFGASGPVVMNASRLWHRARLENRDVTVTANLLPGEDFDSAEGRLLGRASSHPTTALSHVLARFLPARVASAVLARMKIAGDVEMAHFTREARRALVRSLLEWPLPVKGSRGYDHAEVTAGGVPLSEIDPAALESRKCPGLYLVGEILDVDGRIGGFNFQWAWSTGWVAAAALAASLESQPRG